MADLSTPFSRLRRLGLYVLVAGVLGLSIAGCVRLLEPRKGDATYYLLDGSLPSDTLSADTTGLRVGLRQPRLASYLDETRIVTRHGPNTIRFSEFHRWGEDLDNGIGRTVAGFLETHPSIQSVEVVPWPKGAAFDYLLQLHVLSFEGVGPRPPSPDADEEAPPPEGHSQMTVRWTILNPTDETILARDRVQHRETGWPVTKYQALASNLGASLEMLADTIETRLKTLEER